MYYQHKRSDVAGKVPVPEDFKAGQIIVNTADGKLYMLVNGVVKSFSNDDLINDAIGKKLDKNAQAADSLQFNGETASAWQARI
ncbi:hypothetical protein HBA92_20985, partial [Ochrobactrum sp. MR28]|nr:hypothetical protein [Ochrobactrum sp. MR28]MBX8818761.1 hypothetical protein [Ochrobactrum sp. MR31]